MSKLYIVPTPVGNLGDMTPRAVETLKFCQLIAAEDTRHTQKLLNCFEIKTKLISYHKFNEKSRCDEIVNEILVNGKDVAVVTDAGTPCISDPGYELVKAAREAGIEIIGLAGASAMTIGLSISGIDTSQVAFYGFLPRKDGELEDELKKIALNPIRTFVLYESPKRIIRLVEKICQCMPNATVCVCKELTKMHENSFYGTVDEVLDKLNKHEDVNRGEYILVGYNNDYTAEDDADKFNVGLEAIIFDKLIQKGYSLKEAVREIVEEGNAAKNDVYKASLEVKKFIEDFQQLNN